MCTVLVLAATPPLFADPTGREIMEEQKERHDVETEASDERQVVAVSEDVDE